MHAQQQVHSQAGFHYNEMIRAQQALAALRAQPAMQAVELRKLQLQAGQMFSAIKVSDTSHRSRTGAVVANFSAGRGPLQ